LTLTDASALVALVDSGQPASERCRKAFEALSLPLVTTWSAFAEAMHLLHRIGGWPLQRSLWHHVELGSLQIHATAAAEPARMRQLMEQYRDTPMDLADASLVTGAEVLNLSVIFTLDSDFYVYRINNKNAFTVVP